MGERSNPAKGRQELEELYSGIIDDSVDLTFKDLASFQQNGVAEKKKAMTPICEDKDILSKSLSLDFSKGFEGTREHLQHIEDEMNYRISARDSINKTKPLMVVVENNPMHSPFEDHCVRRRPGMPHSNICTTCDTYIYIFRHRCLVCGRVYCRECVLTGMGDMHEGRKCIECLGRRFSERYIHKAGQMGCYCWKYPNNVRLQELKWAEKGPRRSQERRPERCGMASRPMSPMMTPGRMPASTPSMSFMSKARSPTVGTPMRSPCHSVGMSSPYNVKRSSNFLSSPYAFPL